MRTTQYLVTTGGCLLLSAAIAVVVCRNSQYEITTKLYSYGAVNGKTSITAQLLPTSQVKKQATLSYTTGIWMLQRTALSWPRITAHTPDSFRAMSFTVAYSVPETHRTSKEKDVT
jgi:hypothetical protein